MAAKELEVSAAIDYSQLEQVKSQELQKDLTLKLAQKGLGRADSFRRLVLSLVVANHYQEAKDKLQAFFDSKHEYPRFQNRVRRHLNHCMDLIAAIESKRNFPGLAHLALAKRQELFDRVIQHFEELKTYLRQIEIVEKETKILDLRSTVWVVKAIVNAIFFIFIVAVVMDFASGLSNSVFIVVDQGLTDLVDFVVKKFPI